MVATARPAPPEGATFRGVAGHFAGGVTVLIAWTPEGPHGMTASAVVPASFDPPLMALFVARESRMSRLLASGARFTINLLADGGADLAARFAQPGRPSGWAAFAGVDLDLRGPDPPVLRQAIAWVECVVTGRVTAGGHVGIIGEVRAADRRLDGRPLLRYRGSYHGLGGRTAPAAWTALSRADVAADW